jgi:two-component system, OmpR family, sensor histidine kinase KdpD
VGRGTLRIYLGAAPGVGKTFAMLNEGRRAHERGRDVVVGYVETHGRPHTAEQIGDLEVIPRKQVVYRDRTWEEMDVAAILARRPERVLVDEIAHTNVPGSGNEKRWQDVHLLLDAGLDVVSTLNIQHLESLNDTLERITGIRQRETIPDEVVRSADQLELVDMSPEALRRRMAHGNVYPAEKVDAALAQYFRPGNLAALRELALMWVADRVDEALEGYRAQHGITEPWETRERVLVAVTGAPTGEMVVRRAGRMAQRSHGELIGVHVNRTDGLAGPPSGHLERQIRLLDDLGGTYQEIVGDDVAAALVTFARAENCTQMVLGATRRSRWQELVHGSIINRVVRLSGPIDVHVISHEPETGAALRVRLPRRAQPLSPRRHLAGWIAAAAGLPALTVVLANAREVIGLHGVLLLYLLAVVITAAVGGALPAVAAAVAGFLLANWFFTPPYYTWTVAELENVLALVVFLVVAGVVSALVSTTARRAVDAAQARAEAEALARVAATSTEADPLAVLVEQLTTTFRLDAVAVLRRTHDGWEVEAASGAPVPREPGEAVHTIEVADGIVLTMTGRVLSAEDQRVLNAFTAQLGAAIERRRLHTQANRAGALVQANELRAALLQAVSHDLRTPLAAIKASVSSLRQDDIEWSPAETAEFLTTIEEETDRLTALVGNLLDMSRLQAGVISPTFRAVGLDEVVPAAMAGLADRARRVEIDIPEALPALRADPALLERAIANLVDNAVKWSPPDRPVRVLAGCVDDRIELRVVDRGRGIPPADRTRVFSPFQRLGDSPGANGVGLGLAVALGFVAAMDGELFLDDTPGGGTTAIVSLPAA